MKRRNRRTIKLLLLAGVSAGFLMTGCGESQSVPEAEESQSASELQELLEESLEQAQEEEENGSDSKLPEIIGDFHDAGFEQEDVDSDTVQWMCSAYSIYTHYNNKELGIVGGITKSDKERYREAIEDVLDEGWGIRGRDDIEGTLQDLLTEGQRADYKETIEEMKTEGLLDISIEQLLESLSDNENLYRYQAAYLAYQAYGEHGLDGWDYARALQILGDCYQADYLNLKECLDMSLPIAQKLQESFDSWEGVAESYLYGYQYWQKENIDEVNETHFRWKVYDELMEMEDGPYTVPYDTELTNNWENAAEEKEKQVAEEKKAGVSVLRYDDQLSVKVQIPKGFTETSYSSETSLSFEKEREDAYGGQELQYYLYSFLEERDENKQKRIKERTDSLKEDPEVSDLSVGETTERQVGDITVKYVAYSYGYGSLKYMVYDTWAALGEERFIECSFQEVTEAEEKLEVTDDGSIVDEIYKNITW